MHERKHTAELQLLIESHISQKCKQLLQQLHDAPVQSHAIRVYYSENHVVLRLSQITKRKEVVVRLSIEATGNVDLPAQHVDGRRASFHENELAYREFTFPIEGYHTRVTSMSAARHEAPKYVSRALVLQSHAVIRKVISSHPELRFTPKVTGVIIDGAQARSGEGPLTGWSSEMARKLGYCEDHELGGRFTFVYR